MRCVALGLVGVLGACAPFESVPAAPDQSLDDASIDASAGPDAQPAPGSGLPACGWQGFTDNFERAGGGPLGPWDRVWTVGSGIELSIAPAPTARGLSLQVDVIPSTEHRRGDFQHTLRPEGGGACAELAFAIFVETGPTTPEEQMNIASILLARGTALTVWMSTSSLVFAEQDFLTGDPWRGVGQHALSTGGWYDVVMRYTDDGTSPSLVVTVNGDAVATTPIGKVARGPAAHVYVGAGFTYPEVEAKYWLDDVIIR
jgi:hypothetical protein